MTRILRYPVPLRPGVVQRVQTHQGGKVLCIQLQPWRPTNELQLYIMIDPSEKAAYYELMALGTGIDNDNPTSPGVTYKGSVMTPAHEVYHLFGRWVR